MDRISVIIPVFNVKPYLRRCLDSVLCQSYSNLEILLINDGSSDGSGDICDRYAGNDKRVRVFHRVNGGLSSALNVGLCNFTGNYLGFVDSDDWIEPDMFETLYNSAEYYDVPISVTGYSKDTDAGSTPMTNAQPISSGVISDADMLLYSLKRDHYMGFCGYIWNKLYSAAAIKNSQLRFDESIRYGMDVLFYMNLVLSEKCSGAYTDKSLYHYYQRSSAISKSESVDIKTDILKAYKKIERLLDSNGYSTVSYWARGFYCYHAGEVAKTAAVKRDMETLGKMQGEIRTHIDDYERTNEEFPEKCDRMRRLLSLEVNAIGQG